MSLGYLLVIGLFWSIYNWFGKTKLGKIMRAVGQDMAVADAAGIPSMKRTRIIALVISTVFGFCYGQVIFLQNIGTLNTYNSHDQAGMFSIAALLIGGATVSKASISNVFWELFVSSHVCRFAYGGKATNWTSSGLARISECFFHMGSLQ